MSGSSKSRNKIGIATIVLIVITIACYFILKSEPCGMSWQKVFVEKQYYRLFTYLFVHANLRHLIANMVPLFAFATYLEVERGPIQTMLIYFGSGILGGGLSLYMQQHYLGGAAGILSVGASGAIYGLAAALLIDAFLNRRKDRSWVRIPILIVALLASSFSGENVDGWTHIFGFVAGLVVTLIVFLIKRVAHRIDKED